MTPRWPIAARVFRKVHALIPQNMLGTREGDRTLNVNRPAQLTSLMFVGLSCAWPRLFGSLASRVPELRACTWCSWFKANAEDNQIAPAAAVLFRGQPDKHPGSGQTGWCVVRPHRRSTQNGCGISHCLSKLIRAFCFAQCTCVATTAREASVSAAL